VSRSASVVADAPTIAYRLSEHQIDVMEAQDPQLAPAFKSMLIRIIAERLIISDRTLAALSH
jgi:CRP-like cAMP-binding protein